MLAESSKAADLQLRHQSSSSSSSSLLFTPSSINTKDEAFSCGGGGGGGGGWKTNQQTGFCRHGHFLWGRNKKIHHCAICSVFSVFRMIVFNWMRKEEEEAIRFPCAQFVKRGGLRR